MQGGCSKPGPVGKRQQSVRKIVSPCPELTRLVGLCVLEGSGVLGSIVQMGKTEARAGVPRSKRIALPAPTSWGSAPSLGTVAPTSEGSPKTQGAGVRPTPPHRPR